MRLVRHDRGIPLIRAGALSSPLAFLRRIGAPIDGLIERARLRPDELEDPNALVPLVFANRLIDSAARASGIPDFGLLVTRDVDPVTSEYGSLLGRSTTLGGALDASIRLRSSWNTGAKVWLTRVGDDVELHHRFAAARDETWSQMLAATLMLHLNIFRSATGDRWRPRYVRLPMAASRMFQEDPILAQARIDFGARCSTIRFPASMLALPLANPAARLPETGAVRRLEAPPRDFVSSVRPVIASLIGTGHPNIKFVAEAADMNVRTFQRRLADNGLVYAKLVSEIRLAEASRLLVESDRKVTDIALDLGYSDPAHFTRAFRGWTGSSPLGFRRTYRRPEAGLVSSAASALSRSA
jgi:AraC-like DNA-binding protein